VHEFGQKQDFVMSIESLCLVETNNVGRRVKQVLQTGSTLLSTSTLCFFIACVRVVQSNGMLL